MAGKEAPGGDVNHVSTMAPEVGMAELAGTLGNEAGVRARLMQGILECQVRGWGGSSQERRATSNGNWT